MPLSLFGVHLRDLALIQPDMASIRAHHVLGVSVRGHLVEIGVLDGTDDVRTDVERARHGDEVDPLALTRFAKVISV